MTPAPPRSIFVFGSNTEGRHGKGAALDALKNHGAIFGEARGLQGNSYAIVTKDLHKGERSIPLPEIGREIVAFIQFAEDHPNWTFNVTGIGIGLAGYTREEIAPFFSLALFLRNVNLPSAFLEVLNSTSPSFSSTPPTTPPAP